MTINNPFIKDPANIEWLQKNSETFLDFMAKNHSLKDCWHTLLDLSTFNDAYVSSMIKKVELADKKKLKEGKDRTKGMKTPAKTVVEKKMAVFEEAANKKEETEDILPD